ncbi:MAG: hypothetical protein ILA11_10885 [Butyrivibrio sp.]|nr:hypothetical protein [Butyrivibrio sp.]
MSKFVKALAILVGVTTVLILAVPLLTGLLAVLGGLLAGVFAIGIGVVGAFGGWILVILIPIAITYWIMKEKKGE